LQAIRLLGALFYVSLPRLFPTIANVRGSGIRRAHAPLDVPDRKVSAMHNSLETAEVVPTIVALQERLETLRQNELERVSRRLVSFRPEQQDAIEELTLGIVSRILHAPVKVLESASEDEEHAALLSIVHRLFNLGDKPAGRPHQLRQGR
jgi:glutamyl-tRNA reductase